MVNSDTLALVKEFEGCKLEAYRCPVGKWTIGYGHTKGVKPGLEWTQEKADKTLIEELEEYRIYVSKHLENPNPNEVGAFTSFAYNVGKTAFKNSTARKRFNEGKKIKAVVAMQWFNKGTLNGKKVILSGLKRRRKAEGKLMLKSIFSTTDAPKSKRKKLSFWVILIIFLKGFLR